MRTLSNGVAKVSGSIVVMAAALLTGCAVTTSGASFGADAARQDYVVCSGGRASRFPDQQANGRYCRPALSLRDVY